jgi:MFS family permease
MEASRISPGWLLAVLLAPMFMTQADATIVNVAGPSIRSELGASGAELELVLGGYFLAYAMLLITGARLGQMRGFRRLFLVGLAVFTLASLAGGLAPTPTALIVARIVQGIGAALTVPQVLIGIQLSFDGHDRARALGLYSAALAGGAVAGQVLGGLLVSSDLFGTQWRPIFLVNLPIGAAVFAAALRFLPSAPETDSSHRLDLRGVATLSSALLLIVLPLVVGRQEHWPVWTWICLAASAPLLAAFVAVERRLAARGASPLVNLHVVARPAIAWGLLGMGGALATYYALLFTLALYLQEGLGRTPLTSGLILVSWVVAFGLPGRLTPRLPHRVGSIVAPVGFAILAAAYLAISATMFAGQHPAALLVALLGLGGLGLGTAFSATLAHLTKAATPRYAADISGVFTTCLQVAGALGVAAFGTAYLGLVSGSGAAPATHAFAVVTAGFALTALAAGGAAYRATHSAAYRLPAPSRPEPSRRATSSIRSWRSAPVADRGDTAIRAR